VQRRIAVSVSVAALAAVLAVQSVAAANPPPINGSGSWYIPPSSSSTSLTMLGDSWGGIQWRVVSATLSATVTTKVKGTGTPKAYSIQLWSTNGTSPDHFMCSFAVTPSATVGGTKSGQCGGGVIGATRLYVIIKRPADTWGSAGGWTLSGTLGFPPS
jgi:hypothetical protein